MKRFLRRSSRTETGARYYVRSAAEADVERVIPVKLAVWEEIYTPVLGAAFIAKAHASAEGQVVSGDVALEQQPMTRGCFWPKTSATGCRVSPPWTSWLTPLARGANVWQIRVSYRNWTKTRAPGRCEKFGVFMCWPNPGVAGWAPRWYKPRSARDPAWPGCGVTTSSLGLWGIVRWGSR